MVSHIKRKRSFLCVGLDTDIEKIPPHLLSEDDPQFVFNKHIIDNTHEQAVAYKINVAFYESQGVKGWISLKKTIDYLNQYHQDVFTVADAKRGDIGNTSHQYARAFLGGGQEAFDFDAVTVAPYMGEDSVSPFLSMDNKWVILLALTSNRGADDFQMFTQGKKCLFEQVLETSATWGDEKNMMYVVGATQAQKLHEVRKIVPEHFLLIPGVGAQGGSLEDVAAYGMNKNCGLLVNVSRGIIFAGREEDFARQARAKAIEYQKKMEKVLLKHTVI